ncbi:MepB family protein [Janthinobacterium lividum]|uniref:MepB family protein n=1 Tax=Janthinobacterium lividum TaxID=29581 RepID=UPI000874AD12|nr:MepB family protein [Janthinobacterium lividum]MCC7713292.1 MepB family protein [Janthinobacterium lividum]OEZ61112.1 MepB protein [Janthinobacterium lividum]WQE26360.1 MepB family protein [Janthinobacterium lividum]STQ97254.1 MepB protein [Janthinobacterium lividum]
MKASPWAFLGLPQAPVPEAESADYGACRADLHGKRLVLRVAKTTPTKTGQFVTVWKRPHPEADIAPLDEADPVDVVIIAVADDDGARHGFFIFPRSVLLERGVMSRAGQGGKRALRVYPPWCAPESIQALRTQRWQAGCFVAAGDQQRLEQMFGQ